MYALIVLTMGVRYFIIGVMENKNRLSMRIEPELKRRFFEKAKLSGLTPTTAVKLLIMDWLDPVTSFPLRRKAIRVNRSNS